MATKPIPDADLVWMVPVLIEMRQAGAISGVWLEYNSIFVTRSGMPPMREHAEWLDCAEAIALCRSYRANKEERQIALDFGEKNVACA